VKLGNTARGLTGLYGTSLLVSFGHGMSIPTIPVLATAFDVSIGAAAQIVTAYAIGRLGGTLPGGLIVDRLGTRVALVAGPIMIASAALAIALAPTFFMVIVAMLFAGFGDSMFMIGREIAGVDMVRPEQRGRLMSGYMGFNSLGNALGPAVGGVLADLVSYRAVFLLWAGFAVAVLLVSMSLRVTHRERVHVPSAEGPGNYPLLSRGRLVAMLAMFREIEPRFRATYGVLVFATTSMMLYRFALQSMLPLFVVSHRGFSASDVGFLFSIQAVGVFVMIIPAGVVTDKIGRKWATVPSTAIPGIAFLLIPFANSLVEIGLLVAFLGFGSGLSLGSVATSTYDVIPERARGTLQAVRRSVAEIGGIGGPAIGGAVANASNPGVPFLLFGPVVLVAALLLMFVAKETLVKRPRPAASANR
jgi:MFS family permease